MKLTEFLTSCADAIRFKEQSTDKIIAEDIPERIINLSTDSNKPILTDFRIITPPNKIEYNEYDQIFDPTGMSFEADFNSLNVKYTIQFTPDYGKKSSQNSYNSFDYNNYVNYNLNDENSSKYVVSLPVIYPITSLPNINSYITIYPQSQINNSIDHITITFYYGSQSLFVEQEIIFV